MQRRGRRSYVEPWAGMEESIRADAKALRPDLFPAPAPQAPPPVGSRRSRRLAAEPATAPAAKEWDVLGFSTGVHIQSIMDRARAVRARRQRHDAAAAQQRGGRKRARDEEVPRVGAELAALLEERKRRDEGRKRTRAQVAQQLAAEYDVGIRVNPELAKVQRQGASSHDGVDESGTDSE